MGGLLKNLYTLTFTQTVSNHRSITCGMISCTSRIKTDWIRWIDDFYWSSQVLGICPLRCYHSKLTFILPWHVFPWPVYPDLQVQIYDPRVLEQLALMSHTGEEAPHSSMSRTTNILIDEEIIEGH